MTNAANSTFAHGQLMALRMVPTPATKYEYVSTHDLAVGAVVLNHGGLFKLTVRKEHPCVEGSDSCSKRIEAVNGVCVTFKTELLNDGGSIPKSWLADGWTIQGNRAATWARVI